MKLSELKHRVWRAWKALNTWKDGVVLQPDNYVADVKRFGDRRYKKTWIAALARFRAQAIYEGCLDAHMLILQSLNFTPNRWDYEYRNEILDEFLLYPDGLELIKTGLEQLFSTDFTPQEREDADGFYRLVEERQQGGISLPARPVGAGSGTRTAA